MSQGEVDLFQYKSLEDYMKDVLSFKTKKNPQFSLRFFAKKVGIAHSSLSSFLSGQSKLSNENSLKIAKDLELSSLELDFYLILVALQSVKGEDAINILKNRMKLFEGFKREVNKRIERLFDKDLLMEEWIYHLPDSLTFRTLVFFKDKLTGDRSPHFLSKYLSSEREVSSVAYFMKNEDGLYEAYLDQNFSFPKRIELISYENKNLEVKFDSFQLPQIYNYSMIDLLTNEISKFNLKFSKGAILVENIFEENELNTNIFLKYVRYN